MLACALGLAQQGGDDCASAPLIPEIPYCDFGTTNGYAANYFNSCNGSGADVVYRYSSASEGQVRFSLCGSSFDCVLSLWQGCPDGGGVEIVCNDDACGSYSCLSAFLTANETYYLIINGYDGSAGSYRFHAVPATFGCPGTQCGDTYDSCELAQLVSAGSEFPNVFPGSTIGATVDAPPVAPDCSQPLGAGVWFQFSGSDSIITLSLTALTTPHQLFGFCGTCADLTCIDSPPCEIFQTLDICTQLGAVYYVLVAACTATPGTFDLNLASISPCTVPVCTDTANPPTALTIAQNFPDVILRWQPPEGPVPDHYLVYRAGDLSTLTDPVNQIGTTPGLSFTDPDILQTAQARLYYAVTAVTP